MSPVRFLIAACIALVALASQAADKGYLGLGIAVDADGGFWNPTLKSVKVAKVAARSPAEQAGIVVGDQIVEIEGKQIAGAKAKDLQPHLQKDVGQRVNMVIVKASGETRPVSIVAGPKPQ